MSNDKNKATGRTVGGRGYIKKGAFVHRVPENSKKHSLGQQITTSVMREKKWDEVNGVKPPMTPEEFHAIRRAEEEIERAKLQQLRKENEEHERAIRIAEAAMRKAAKLPASVEPDGQ